GTLGIAGGWPEPQNPEQKPKQNASSKPDVVAETRPRVDQLGDLLPKRAVARLGTERFRPGQEIEAIAFSPDGQKLACWAGSYAMKGELTIWEVATGRLLRNLPAPTSKLKLLHWLPNGHGCALLRTSRESYFIWDFTDESTSPPPVLNPGALYSQSP